MYAVQSGNIFKSGVKKTHADIFLLVGIWTCLHGSSFKKLM